jgi:DNA-3-methyladenine glycosylase I
MKTRCPWARNEFSIPYHDEEWGVPVRDDRTWFEFLILEGAQAGLSWTRFCKRALPRVLDGFDAVRVARYGDRKVFFARRPGHHAQRLKDPRRSMRKPSSRCKDTAVSTPTSGNSPAENRS